MVPRAAGYCVEKGKTGGRHEHCRCNASSESIETCRVRCDNDFKCKGYSFRKKYSKCYLYTTSTCSNGCNKRNKGRLGDMKEVKANNESGCYIKKKSTLINHFLISYDN